ncbi:MAG: hypothetical protein Q4F05_03030 [bacterium]|nr:hypothetical protein [bacterium]
MSREDYDILKEIGELRNNSKHSSRCNNDENDELIIEENTIYEIDYDCYECLMKERKQYLQGK